MTTRPTARRAGSSPHRLPPQYPTSKRRPDHGEDRTKTTSPQQPRSPYEQRHRIVDTRPGRDGETYVPDTTNPRQDPSPRPVPELDASGQPWRITADGRHVGAHNGEDYCLEWLPVEDTPQAQHERGELTAEQLREIEARRAPAAGRLTIGRGLGLAGTDRPEADERKVAEDGATPASTLHPQMQRPAATSTTARSDWMR